VDWINYDGFMYFGAESIKMCENETTKEFKQMRSATLVVSLFKVLVSFKIEFSELDFALSVFDDCVLKTDLALFDVFHDLAQKTLKNLTHIARIVH
jgi:hypothetical protein